VIYYEKEIHKLSAITYFGENKQRKKERKKNYPNMARKDMAFLVSWKHK